MKPKLTILGCGYLGSALARKAIAKSWQVAAFTRNQKTAESLLSLGVDDVQTGSLEDHGWHSCLDANQDFVVVCVGASSPDLKGYNQSYLEGLKSVKKWITGTTSTASVIFTSSTSVYPQADGGIVDEKSTHDGASPRAQILLEAEKECLSLNVDKRKAFVLRLAGLYGPGRHLLVDKIRRSEKMKGKSNRILNLIHRDDAVEAVITVLENALRLQSTIYNVSDDEWATRGESVEWLSSTLKLPNPQFDESEHPGSPNRKVSSRLLRSESDWRPRYYSFQKAYQEMLASA